VTNQSKEKALSIIDILAMKGRGEKISCLTAYDAGFASIIDRVGIDIMLVGDSLGMVVQGHTTTVPVTIENMLYHTTCVTRVRKRAFVISDLPFNTYSNPKAALKNAARLMQEAGAHMVKLEGARPDCVRLLIQEGIPVCGHLGLQPQSIFRLGSYGVQGKEPLSSQKIRNDALLLQEAGIGLLILECVPASLAFEISRELTIPVIGIGAGIDCDGQVLVLYDMLNIGIGKRPRFSKNFMIGHESVESAIAAYHQAVKKAEFPSFEHSF
jgi:3-methyl-2-oxobutanoate hydroxymethyltransferase